MANKSFTLALAAFEKHANVEMKNVVRKITFELFTRVVMRSPVDTGRFRANWGVKPGSIYKEINVDKFDKTPRGNRSGRTVAEVQTATAQWNAHGSIFLCNNVEYAIPLEYGHSQQQAPEGMVRISIIEMQNGLAEQIAAGKL